MVINSSKVSLVSPTTRSKWNFIDLTAASHSPPKCGAHSGINLHSMHWAEQKHEMSLWVFCLLKNLYISFNSWLAPVKLVPWSLKIRLGLPRQAIKRLSEVMKASVVRSETGSKCTALLKEKHIDRHTPWHLQASSHEYYLVEHRSWGKTFYWKLSSHLWGRPCSKFATDDTSSGDGANKFAAVKNVITIVEWCHEQGWTSM